MSKVGDGLEAHRADWKFRDEAAVGFDEHVSKSVPFYREGHELVCELSDFFIKPDSTCYEIGCATGELTLKLAAHNNRKPAARFVGVDIEPDMIELAGKKLGGARLNVEFTLDDALQMEFEPADLFVAYYTIQFVRPSERQRLIDKIFANLQWGGALLMFEKVRGPDARFQDILTRLYEDYKLRQGYSPEEIIAKARSLKGILEPFSTQGNLDMLKRAGFIDVTTVMKFINFEGFLAIK